MFVHRFSVNQRCVEYTPAFGTFDSLFYLDRTFLIVLRVDSFKWFSEKYCIAIHVHLIRLILCNASCRSELARDIHTKPRQTC